MVHDICILFIHVSENTILGGQAETGGEDNVETRRGRKAKEGTRSKERAGAFGEDQVIEGNR